MIYKLLKLLIMFGLVLSLAACVVKDKKAEKIEEEDSKPVDLTGEWKQVNSKPDETYQRATIKDGEITIYWVNEAEKTESLYWAGTYEPMKEAAEIYIWDSVNDKEKTSTAQLASSEETKTFSYNQEEELSYYVSVNGTTKTVTLEKKE